MGWDCNGVLNQSPAWTLFIWYIYGEVLWLILMDFHPFFFLGRGGGDREYPENREIQGVCEMYWLSNVWFTQMHAVCGAGFLPSNRSSTVYSWSVFEPDNFHWEKEDSDMHLSNNLSWYIYIIFWAFVYCYSLCRFISERFYLLPEQDTRFSPPKSKSRGTHPSKKHQSLVNFSSAETFMNELSSCPYLLRCTHWTWKRSPWSPNISGNLK